jgi:hypothetical protein
MRILLGIALLGVATAFPAYPAGEGVPMSGVTPQGRDAQPEARARVPERDGRREVIRRPGEQVWQPGGIPEQRRAPDEIDGSASTGASAPQRGGTDLGIEAEKEDEAFRKKESK